MGEERATGAGSAAAPNRGRPILIGADLWPETAAEEGLVRVVEIEKEREGEGAAGAWVAGGGGALGAVARCGPP